LVEAIIRPKTNIGEVTARILAFDAPERVVERAELRQLNRYPSAEARNRMATE
jgi:hypothetical protein